MCRNLIERGNCFTIVLSKRNNMENYLNDLSKKVYETAQQKGFHDEPIPIPQLLMLVVSELSEALEADRKGKFSVCGSFTIAALTKYKGSLSTLPMIRPDLFNELFEIHVKDTFQDEIADALIRILDLCAEKNIDIDWHVKMKMQYNALRQHKNGGKKY